MILDYRRWFQWFLIILGDCNDWTHCAAKLPKLQNITMLKLEEQYCDFCSMEVAKSVRLIKLEFNQSLNAKREESPCILPPPRVCEKFRQWIRFGFEFNVNQHFLWKWIRTKFELKCISDLEKLFQRFMFWGGEVVYTFSFLFVLAIFVFDIFFCISFVLQNFCERFTCWLKGRAAFT